MPAYLHATVSKKLHQISIIKKFKSIFVNEFGIMYFIYALGWFLFQRTPVTNDAVSKYHKYNCHNIYWDPLSWMVKNGHLIILTCISFFNEHSFVLMRGVWYCATLLWREMDSRQLLTLYYTLTQIFSGSLDLPSTQHAHLRRWISSMHNNQITNYWKLKNVSVLSRKRWPIIPDFLFLNFTNTHAKLHLPICWKILPILPFPKKKLMCV